jgi:putative tryptophan/tyrosine transport system substrate-binding protein
MKSFLSLIPIVATLMGTGVVAQAQQPAKIFRLGLLTFASPPPPSTPTPLDQGLRKLGYVEGQNIVIEPRYANGQMNRLPELAVDLARAPVDVILAVSYPAALSPSKRPRPSPSLFMGPAIR